MNVVENLAKVSCARRAMKIVVIAMIVVPFQQSLGQVTLRLVNERACSGDELAFSCERATGSGLLVWDITALPGVLGIRNVFARTLNSYSNAARITSTDTTSGPNPSRITIHNVTAADNGATVQCHIVDMESSNIFTLFIRPPECSVALQATAMTDTSITVMLMWTSCEGAEPSTVSLRWFPEHNSCNVRYIGSLPANYEITDLVSSTNYSIMASFTDACGSISAMIVAATLPSTSMVFSTSQVAPAPTTIAEIPMIGAACIPAISALSTLLAILLALVILMTVALLVVCCKLRTLSTADTIKPAGIATTSQYNEVEMTQNPAYGSVATTVVKGEVQYEEVAPATGGYSS